MKYAMYNVVWYDGVDAFVTKFILPDSEKVALKDLQNFWTLSGYDGDILKIDKLYGVSLENIIALRNGNDKDIRTYEYFEQMYF